VPIVFAKKIFLLTPDVASLACSPQKMWYTETHQQSNDAIENYISLFFSLSI
jgi:hypothetical protein